MSEPPIAAGPDGVEPSPPRVGRPHLDITIAVIAIVISVISLGVGFYNAQSEQRMVAATSWPFLVYETMRDQRSEPARITLRIANEGVGPARLKSLLVRYAGKPAHGLVELLQLCCGLAPDAGWTQLDKLGLVTESRAVGLYRPGVGTDLVVLKRTPENAAMWDRLAEARLHLSFRACYCSVLGDCWTSDLDATSDPEPVNRCSAVDGYKE